jgi:NAD(P)H dehydrogenase (quinone)
MNVLIIYAHPYPASLNAALKDRAVSVLQDMNHTVKVSDLYAMKFKAVLDQDDFLKPCNREYFSIPGEQVAGVRNGTLAPDIQTEMHKVEWANLLIFQFPIWWSSMPAILKGWIDRVLAQGFAVNLAEGQLYREGLLSGKKALISTTAGSPPEFYCEGGPHGDINHHLMSLWHNTIEFCGMEVVPTFYVFNAGFMDDLQVNAELERYEEYLRLL